MQSEHEDDPHTGTKTWKTKETLDREPQRNAEIMRKTDEESNATAGAERTTE